MPYGIPSSTKVLSASMPYCASPSLHCTSWSFNHSSGIQHSDNGIEPSTSKHARKQGGFKVLAKLKVRGSAAYSSSPLYKQYDTKLH
jgi:hypothetical protein